MTADTHTVKLNGTGASLSPEYLRDVAAKNSKAVLFVMNPHIATIADALDIADEFAVCLIVSDSHPTDIDGEQWWDTSAAEPGAGMEQALRYVEARGLLIRHAENAQLVRFKESAE